MTRLQPLDGGPIALEDGADGVQLRALRFGCSFFLGVMTVTVCSFCGGGWRRWVFLFLFLLFLFLLFWWLLLWWWLLWWWLVWWWLLWWWLVWWWLLWWWLLWWLWWWWV